MKKLFFLLLMLSSTIYGQIKSSEFSEALQLLQGNNPEKALSNLEILEKKFPTDAQVIFLRGFYHFRNGNQNGAMMSFSNAIKANPKYAIAYGGRAQLFYTKGMLDKAISDISEAVKLEPKNVDYLTTRAGFYNSNRQFAEGLEDMKTKILLDPNNIMGYYDAAVFAKALDPNYDSDNFFNQAYANKGISKFLTDVLFGKFLMKNARFEEAKTKFEAALAISENDFNDEDFNDVGIVYYKLKIYDKSISYFNKALAIMPSNVSVHLNLASVYMDLKDWQKVKEVAQGALDQDSNNAMANMIMAIGLKYTGNESLASEYENKSNQLAAEQNK